MNCSALRPPKHGLNDRIGRLFWFTKQVKKIHHVEYCIGFHRWDPWQSLKIVRKSLEAARKSLEIVRKSLAVIKTR